jgi:hypothetical protein
MRRVSRRDLRDGTTVLLAGEDASMDAGLVIEDRTSRTCGRSGREGGDDVPVRLSP